MAFLPASRRPVASSLFLLLRRLSSAPSVPHPAFDPEIRRLARLRRFTDIESLLEPLKKDRSHASSEPFLASVVASYASSGMIDHALRTLDELPRLGSPRTAVSLNALLSALNHSPHRFGRRRLVPELFDSLSRKLSIAPDAVSYGLLIKSHCLAGQTKKALPILKEIEEKKIEVNTVIYTTILDSLYKENKPEVAQRLWTEMNTKGIKPDLPAYNVRVMYRALHGKPKEVLDLISEIEAEGLKPDTITYNYLIACYCTHGKFGDAKKVYKELEEKGCVPNSATYKILVSALCKNGDFDGSLDIFADSLKRSKVPDLSSMKLLVEGLVKTSKLRAAKRVVNGLKNKFPEDFAGEWKKLESMVELNTDKVGSDGMMTN
ncbi:hypothetical protein Cni_G03527 [Canna indica]|uniref:Pentatricopeptide repeat-containing protein n=1 Tax=Canna indica TaxID=4628 RepID=A0AAQ3Q3L9_9LILI|nr:hypothetical protein Cni_G03527 [Canna indica]